MDDHWHKLDLACDGWQLVQVRPGMYWITAGKSYVLCTELQCLPPNPLPHSTYILYLANNLIMRQVRSILLLDKNCFPLRQSVFFLNGLFCWVVYLSTWVSCSHVCFSFLSFSLYVCPLSFCLLCLLAFLLWFCFVFCTVFCFTVRPLKVNCYYHFAFGKLVLFTYLIAIKVAMNMEQMGSAIIHPK